MNQIARIISIIFSPYLVPTYGILLGLFLTPLVILPLSIRIGSVFLILLFTGLLPMSVIVGMVRFGIISNRSLDNRKDRTFPYLAALLLYGAALVYLYRASAPDWLLNFMFGGTIALMIVSIVNLKWKISAHMTAVGGLLMFVLLLTGYRLTIYPMMLPLLLVILICGMVGVARLGLEKHTLSQVAAGFVCGFMCVYLCSFF